MSHHLTRESMTGQRGHAREPIRDAYECSDGYFEVRDDAGPHRWIACRDPVAVRS